MICPIKTTRSPFPLSFTNVLNIRIHQDLRDYETTVHEKKTTKNQQKQQTKQTNTKPADIFISSFMSWQQIF